MQCKCGAETKKAHHKVTTPQQATEWCKGFTPRNLPVIVEQDKCPGCGRMSYKVWEGKKVIYAQG